MSESWLWTGLKWIVAAFIAFWVSVPAAVKLLVILSAFDLVSCLFTHRASVKATLRRIVVTLLLVGAVDVVYIMAKDLSGFNLGFDVGTAVALFYVLGEMIELALNCSTVVDLPPWLLSLLEKAQGMTGKQRRELEAQNNSENPLMR